MPGAAIFPAETDQVEVEREAHAGRDERLEAVGVGVGHEGSRASRRHPAEAEGDPPAMGIHGEDRALQGEKHGAAGDLSADAGQREQKLFAGGVVHPAEGRERVSSETSGDDPAHGPEVARPLTGQSCGSKGRSEGIDAGTREGVKRGKLASQRAIGGLAAVPRGLRAAKEFEERVQRLRAGEAGGSVTSSQRPGDGNGRRASARAARFAFGGIPREGRQGGERGR